MEKSPIAENIRAFRKSRHWTQEELLAIASGVDVRTIQRAEAGQPLSVESLKALAAAFDTTVEGLSSSREDVGRALEDFRKKYTLIQLDPVGPETDLQNLMAAPDAFQLQRIGVLSEPQADAIASLEQDVRDYLDVWNGLEPLQKRDGEKHLRSVFDDLASLNVTVWVGRETVALRFENGGSPMRMTILYLAAVSGGVALRVLAREKGIPVSFA